MKFLSSVIVFSILGLCLTEEHLPTNHDEFLQKLSKPPKDSSASSEKGLVFPVTEAKKLLKQMEEFCSISKHNISVSAKCCTDLKITLISFITGQEWAIKMVDSLGKPPSGIMSGNIFFPGDYKECKSISVNITPTLTPKYCQAKIPVYVPKVQQQINFIFGLCVPNSCNVADCEHLFHEGLHMLPFHLGDKLNATVNCPKEIGLDTKAIVAITVCCVLIVFIVLGTLCDIFFQKTSEIERLTINSNESPSDEIQVDNDVALLQPAPPKAPGCLKKFFLCFSLLKNIEKLLKTKLPNQSLPAIHGIRFLSMTWVILGHAYFFGLGTTGNIMTLLDMSGRFTFQVIESGIYAVDTFFLISGMLVSYGTLKVLTEKGRMNWLYFYIHRFYRLTPTYLVVLMFYVCLMKYFGNGPYWRQEELSDVCTKTWWRNVLYSNNFIKNAGCMGWTWYLANDMQFYVISPLLVILLHKFPKIGTLVTMSLMGVHFVVSAILIIHYGIKSPSNPNYMDLYMKPYYRIGPYLVGILLGYILHVTNRKKTLNKVFVACTWMICKSVAVVVVYGLYKKNGGESFSQPVATLYWLFSHTAWSVCVAWLIFACCTGYGGIVNRFLSWKAFIPLSRLTYCAYLIHPIVMIIYYYNLPYPMIITDSVMSYLFIGHLVITYGVSFLVSMIIESPLMKIEAVFLRKLE